MKDNVLDKALTDFDYSSLSNVKGSLLNSLLLKHRQDNFGKFESLSQRLKNEILSEDELESVAAAGTVVPPYRVTKNGEEFPEKIQK